jgi:hypothetical protein
MSRIVVPILTLATAGIHLAYTTTHFDGIMMALSGLGYLTLLALLYLPTRAVRERRRLVRDTLVGYTLLVVLGYVAYGVLTGEWSVPLGPIAKVIEIALIGALLQGRGSDAPYAGRWHRQRGQART